MPLTWSITFFAQSKYCRLCSRSQSLGGDPRISLRLQILSASVTRPLERQVRPSFETAEFLPQVSKALLMTFLVAGDLCCLLEYGDCTLGVRAPPRIPATLHTVCQRVVREWEVRKLNGREAAALKRSGFAYWPESLGSNFLPGTLNAR